MPREEKKTMFRSLCAITIGVLGLTAAAQAQAAEAIKVGISQPISGANGDYFKRELVNPAILAIEEVNAKGGVLGHKVEYVIEDNKANAATALAVARKLIDIDHVSMISISITPAVLATLPVAEENHIVVMSAAQHPKIAQSPWGFLSTPAAPVFGIVQARFAFNDLKARTAGIMGENNDAVRTTTTAFAKEFEKLGGKVLDVETFNHNDVDFQAQLTKLRAANPDVMNMEPTGPNIDGLILKQAAELHFRPKNIIAGDFIIDPQARAIAGDLVSGIYYTVVEFDHDWNEKVFKKRFGYNADGFAARIYDGVSIYFAAVKKAGTSDPEKIRETLRHFTGFHGVLGTWGYNGTGDPAMLPTVKRVP
jgi:branched-chain amino acid transport system substrate-binding protein